MIIENTNKVKLVMLRGEVMELLMNHIGKTHDVAGMNVESVKLTEDGFTIEYSSGAIITNVKLDIEKA